MSLILSHLFITVSLKNQYICSEVKVLCITESVSWIPVNIISGFGIFIEK